eukprot:6211202-Pleurochrysis_carterae.AAC.6
MNSKTIVGELLGMGYSHIAFVSSQPESAIQVLLSSSSLRLVFQLQEKEQRVPTASGLNDATLRQTYPLHATLLQRDDEAAAFAKYLKSLLTRQKIAIIATDGSHFTPIVPPDRAPFPPRAQITV